MQLNLFDDCGPSTKEKS